MINIPQPYLEPYLQPSQNPDKNRKFSVRHMVQSFAVISVSILCISKLLKDTGNITQSEKPMGILETKPKNKIKLDELNGGLSFVQRDCADQLSQSAVSQ